MVTQRVWNCDKNWIFSKWVYDNSNKVTKAQKLSHKLYSYDLLNLGCLLSCSYGQWWLKIFVEFVEQSIPKTIRFKTDQLPLYSKKKKSNVWGVQKSLWHGYKKKYIYSVLDKLTKRPWRMKCFDLTCHLCFGWQIDTKVGREERREKERSGHKGRTGLRRHRRRVRRHLRREA